MEKVKIKRLKPCDGISPDREAREAINKLLEALAEGKEIEVE